MKKQNYILGLDLGVGSVGWSCMKIDQDHQPCRLIEANSFIFPQERGSMEDRRAARGLRRLIRRKKGRIQSVKRLFLTYHYLEAEEIKNFYNSKVLQYDNPYELKCKGLEEKLNKDELFICLMHYAKYRGFRSNRKNKEEAKSSASASEEQKLLYSIEQTQQALDEKGYTISQYIVNDPKFQSKIKNTDGQFHIGVTRKMIQEEASTLLDKQIELGTVDQNFKQDYLDILTYQRSFSDGPNDPSPYAHPLQKMVGKCGFDGEQRAPLCAPSYELFILIQKLQNIRYYEQGTRDYLPLSKPQIDELIKTAMKGTELKYKHVQKLFDHSVQFKGLVLTKKDYAKVYEINKEHPEKSIEDIRDELKLNQSIYQMKSTKYMLSFLKKQNQQIDDMQVLDEIADLLSKYKSDAEIKRFMEDYPKLSTLPDILKQTIVEFDESKFKEFGKLSFSILYKLLPLMQDDQMSYSEAMNALELDHSKKKTNEDAYDQLPALDQAFDELEMSVTNRSAIATLQEAKAIINKLISKYGKPYAIHVELARELCKNPKERYQIMDEQLNNKVNKMNLKMQILNKYPHVFQDISNIHHDDIVKYRLYMEQGGIDPYTLAATGDENLARIHEKDLFSRDLEIDHILPYSKSFNDTMSNKVLVYAKMNQEKGNHVPGEVFKNSIGFHKYVTWLQRIRDVKKRSNFMAEKITEDMLDDFSARALNDTRYATRVLCDVLRYYFPDVVIRSFTGQVTAKLKGVWGLNGHTHSYASTDNYRVMSEKNEELLQLQEALSDLVINHPECEDGIANLKKQIISYEKEIFMKNRDNHLHHALDATVIACATDTLRRRVEIHEQNLRQESQEIKRIRIANVNPETGEFIDYSIEPLVSKDFNQYYDLTKNINPKQFPKPYLQFRDEVLMRIYERDEQTLRKKLCTFTNYTPEDIQQVHPLYIAHKCDKKVNGRLHKATIYGVAPSPTNKNDKVLTNRIRINTESFDQKKLEKLYDKEGTQKQIYDIVKEWLSGHKNGQMAYKAHNNQYPVNKNGNSIQKVKLDFDAPKEQICIHKDKNQYVDKENVIQVHVYKKQGSDKLYFVGMDRYRVMNYKENPTILIWSGRDKNFESLYYNDLAKNGYSLYRKLFKNQVIKLSLRNGASGLCKVVGCSSGMFEIGSLLGDAEDLVYDKLMKKSDERNRITISTIRDIEIVHMDILGNIKR